MKGEVEFNWPTFPVHTAGGKLSKAKSAGKRVPWLSINNINNMHRRVHQQCRAYWREAAAHPSYHDRWDEEGPNFKGGFPVRLTLLLFKSRGNLMDVGAGLEGMKPIIDGMVQAGYLPSDTPYYVTGVDVLPAVAVGDKGQCKVVVRYESAQAAL